MATSAAHSSSTLSASLEMITPVFTPCLLYTSISLDGDVVTYTITLTNDASAGAPMVNPFLVDLLPQGMLLNGANGNVQLTDAPAGVTIENTRSNTSEGETALFVFLSGALAPGESVKLTVQVKSTSAVATRCV